MRQQALRGGCRNWEIEADSVKPHQELFFQGVKGVLPNIQKAY